MKFAVPKNLPMRKLIFMIPLFLFLVIAFFSWKRGERGIWHDQCKEFWQRQQWQKIMALGENLWRAGGKDTESLYFAMLASAEAKDPEALRRFSERLRGQKLLNSKIEKNLRHLSESEDAVSFVQVHRTDAVISIFLILMILTLASLKKSALLPWVSALSVLGILVLRL